MRKPLMFIALCGLAACTAPEKTAEAPPPPPVQGGQSPMPAGEAGVQPAGAPADCVPITGIRETRVKDDRTIDFYMRGGQVYRNRLPYSCSQLGFERAFSYATSLSQLCSTDIITVIIQGGGPMRGASCGLGQFQPVTGAPR